uniref:Uncharacterized protein TCIL3000_10_12510 n=1 Tax=Trypanosoma congolense (strain IL3000) TaxID=1068625 RepID=G0UYK2_TRYCI|nr:unnamed protein product [Trypanosoma congolense IL3000]
MSRSWCALARAGEKRPFDATHLGRCAAEEEDAIRSFGALSAKQRGDIAVQHGLAAKALESEVTHKVESSISRFSACIVISKANIRHWPNTESLSMRTISHGTLTLVANAEDETVCLLRGNVPVVAYHVSHIWSACPHLSSLPSIQLPSDQVMEFLNQIMRTEAQSKNYDLSSSMRHISLMQAPATTVSAEDIFAVIGANHHLLSQLRTLTIAGEFNEETELGELSSFFQRAKFLEVLGLPHTKFSRISESFLPLLRDTMIRVADFEGNDLGLTKDVDDSVPLLAEYIKFNKFLMELNLNNNNLSGSSAQTLLEALVKSDTRLYPEDLTKELFGAEEEEDAYGCDLESVSFFLPHEDDDEEEDIEEEEEDEGEDGNPLGWLGEKWRRRQYK